MNISVRQLIGAVVVSFCVGAFITPVGTQVQGAAKPAQSPPPAAKQATYMQVEFMQVPEGKKQAGSSWSESRGSRCTRSG
jgi:hypothetical protein